MRSSSDGMSSPGSVSVTSAVGSSTDSVVAAVGSLPPLLPPNKKAAPTPSPASATTPAMMPMIRPFFFFLRSSFIFCSCYVKAFRMAVFSLKSQGRNLFQQAVSPLTVSLLKQLLEQFHVLLRQLLCGAGLEFRGVRLIAAVFVCVLGGKISLTLVRIPDDHRVL